MWRKGIMTKWSFLLFFFAGDKATNSVWRENYHLQVLATLTSIGGTEVDGTCVTYEQLRPPAAKLWYMLVEYPPPWYLGWLELFHWIWFITLETRSVMLLFCVSNFFLYTNYLFINEINFLLQHTRQCTSRVIRNITKGTFFLA